MSKRSDKLIKRAKKKHEHELYLKRLFAKYGHGLKVTSNREAVGNKYFDRMTADKIVKEMESND
jgi:vacuolar-type H+-ATPase subunit B/Vma2